MRGASLYKCEFDRDMGSIQSDLQHRIRYIVATSIADAAEIAERPRRRNLEITEISKHVDIADGDN